MSPDIADATTHVWRPV